MVVSPSRCLDSLTPRVPSAVLTVVQTAAPTSRDLHRATPDAQRLPVHERIRHLPVSRIDDPANGRAGDVHLLGRLLVAKSAEVHEPHGLELIEVHHHLFQLNHRDADRLEDWRGWSPSDPAGEERS
jgi:hypothetical protein